MSGKTVEDYVNEIDKLADKAGLIREICAYQHRKYRWISSGLSLSILFFSASIAFLSVADPTILISLSLPFHAQQDTRNVIAFLGFLIFVISFSDRILNLTETMNKNEQGVKILTDFIRDCHTFTDSGAKDCDEVTAALKLESIKEQYGYLNQVMSPNTLFSKTFLKIKKGYKMKVKVSKMLDGDPNISINRHYKMRIWNWLF